MIITFLLSKRNWFVGKDALGEKLLVTDSVTVKLNPTLYYSSKLKNASSFGKDFFSEETKTY